MEIEQNWLIRQSGSAVYGSVWHSTAQGEAGYRRSLNSTDVGSSLWLICFTPFGIMRCAANGIRDVVSILVLDALFICWHSWVCFDHG